MHRWRLALLQHTTALRYETASQNVGRSTKASFHVPATGKAGRPRCLGKEESFSVCPTKGRWLHDTTDKGWEQPTSTHTAELKGNPSHSLKFRHRSQGAHSAPAKESTVATHGDSQGLQQPGFGTAEHPTATLRPSQGGRWGEERRPGRRCGSLQVRGRHWPGRLACTSTNGRAFPFLL